MRTTTGSNLRNILLLTGLDNIDDLLPTVIETIKYKQISNDDMWRVQLIKEILDMKHGVIDLPEGWTIEEAEDILNLACTQ